MKQKATRILLLLFAVFALALTGCSDGKAPISGYISDEDVLEIIKGFDSSVTYSSYDVEGNLNYFNIDEETIERTVNYTDRKFNDSTEVFNRNCASYYLNVPLHITLTNWQTEAVNSSNLPNSTKYQLESKIIRPAGLDKVYYYKRDGGGFIIRAFAVNKALIVENPVEINCRAKWNIIIEYDSNGFLVYEKFDTLNASEANKSESCYGQASYSYF